VATQGGKLVATEGVIIRVPPSSPTLPSDLTERRRDPDGVGDHPGRLDDLKRWLRELAEEGDA